MKTWIVDLESFTVEAETYEEAIEKAQEHLRTEGAGIDSIIEDKE